MAQPTTEDTNVIATVTCPRPDDTSTPISWPTVQQNDNDLCLIYDLVSRELQ